jgi:hypothetical protein
MNGLLQKPEEITKGNPHGFFLPQQFEKPGKPCHTRSNDQPLKYGTTPTGTMISLWPVSARAGQ